MNSKPVKPGSAALICFSPSLLAALTQAEEINACDRLAGSPQDPSRVGPGVPFFSIDGEAALAACTTAERDHPNTVRFAYRLGLALARVKRYPRRWSACVRRRKPGTRGRLGLRHDGVWRSGRKRRRSVSLVDARR